jgi:hypothetical protein
MGLMGVQPVGIGLHDFTSFEKQQAELSVGMRATNASAWSRAARSRAVMSFGSRGSLLCNALHSAAGWLALRRISAISPSGVKPGDLSTAAQIMAPRGRMVS